MSQLLNSAVVAQKQPKTKRKWVGMAVLKKKHNTPLFIDTELWISYNFNVSRNVIFLLIPPHPNHLKMQKPKRASMLSSSEPRLVCHQHILFGWSLLCQTSGIPHPFLQLVFDSTAPSTWVWGTLFPNHPDCAPPVNGTRAEKLSPKLLWFPSFLNSNYHVGLIFPVERSDCRDSSSYHSVTWASS